MVICRDAKIRAGSLLLLRNVCGASEGAKMLAPATHVSHSETSSSFQGQKSTFPWSTLKNSAYGCLCRGMPVPGARVVSKIEKEYPVSLPCAFQLRNQSPIRSRGPSFGSFFKMCAPSVLPSLWLDITSVQSFLSVWTEPDRFAYCPCSLDKTRRRSTYSRVWNGGFLQGRRGFLLQNAGGWKIFPRYRKTLNR